MIGQGQDFNSRDGEKAKRDTSVQQQEKVNDEEPLNCQALVSVGFQINSVNTVVATVKQQQQRQQPTHKQGLLQLYKCRYISHTTLAPLHARFARTRWATHAASQPAPCFEGAILKDAEDVNESQKLSTFLATKTTHHSRGDLQLGWLTLIWSKMKEPFCSQHRDIWPDMFLNSDNQKWTTNSKMDARACA